MYFSYEQKRAVYSVAQAMVLADNRVKEIEMHAFIMEMQRLGCTADEVIKIGETISSMTPSNALTIMSAMTSEQKRHVCSLLGTIMAVDGHIDDSEMNLWRFVSTICDFPTMTPVEAVKYMANL